MSETAPAPLTRRELREIERAGEKRQAARQATPASGVRPTVVQPAIAVAPFAAAASDASPSGVPDAAFPVAELPAIVPVKSVSPSASASPSVLSSSSPASSPAAGPASGAPTARARRSAASTRVRRARAAKPVPTTSLRSRASTRLLSFGALLFAGAMVVGLSVPASAFFVNSPTVLMAADAPAQAEGQIITSDAAGAADVVEYDTWGVASQAELRQASTIRVDKSYTVDNSGAVRWPFPVAVPISDGFGARVSPCSGCSTQHKGTDFTPGIGTAISAIADGVVSQKTTSAWGFGYHVYIDHVINGKKVTSVYAHMLLGSSDLDVGDVVKAGDFVGLVGQTGAATGPHLHLEIRVEGVQVDPFLWLKVNAGE